MSKEIVQAIFIEPEASHPIPEAPPPLGKSSARAGKARVKKTCHAERSEAPPTIFFLSTSGAGDGQKKREILRQLRKTGLWKKPTRHRVTAPFTKALSC